MNRGNTQPNRGRGTNRRGNRRNFGDESVQRQEAAKQEELRNKIDSKKKEETPPDPKIETEKHGLIEKGKAWISKFFRGQVKTERGNVKVDLRHDIDMQLYSLYETRLLAWITDLRTTQKTQQRSMNMLRPLISTMIGIKLLKANTQSGKASMIEFRGLENMDLEAPKRLTSIINHLGKSDALYDNVIRIRSQNLYAKTSFFKAIIDYYGRESRLWNRNLVGKSENFTFDEVSDYRERFIKQNRDLNFYDETVDGAKFINYFGHKAADFINKFEFKIRISGTTKMKFRLPYLDPDKLDDLDYILEWAKTVKPCLDYAQIDADVYGKVISTAVLGYMPLHWIKNRKRQFEEIDNRFKGTIFEGLVIEGAMGEFNLQCMDDLMTNEMLITNMLLLIEEYKEIVTPVYNRIFNMTRFICTEFGSSAQVVQGHKMQKKYLESDDYDRIDVVDKKTEVNSFLKMTESDALMGIMLKLNDDVTFTSNYELNYEGRINEIQLEYVISDFKT